MMNSTYTMSATSSKKEKKEDKTYPYKHEVGLLVVFITTLFLILFAFHSTWVTAEAYSSPSIVLAAKQPDGSRLIFDDFREAYYWLRMNTAEDAKVMSWWDYGYQISSMANRTTLVDNNTWNNTHISRVGQAMSSTEDHAYEIMRELDVDYVLVLFGGLSGYASDDINKFLWMVRIGGSTPEGAHIKVYCHRIDTDKHSLRYFRKLTTLRPRASSAWTAPDPKFFRTASCTRCATTVLVKSTPSRARPLATIASAMPRLASRTLSSTFSRRPSRRSIGLSESTRSRICPTAVVCSEPEAHSPN